MLYLLLQFVLKFTDGKGRIFEHTFIRNVFFILMSRLTKFDKQIVKHPVQTICTNVPTNRPNDLTHYSTTVGNFLQ